MVQCFGQAVIGPPGAGKTTYCHGMTRFLYAKGRPVILVNLDPANDRIPFTPDIDISDLVNLAGVMEEHDLGPNGGLVYCMEYIEKNIDWLLERLDQAVSGNHQNQSQQQQQQQSPSTIIPRRYIIFDFPGQVELYTHGDTVQRIFQRLEKWGCRLTTVHLIDAHHCSDAGKFISAALISLTTMIRLELPHVNVLSKVDLIESYGRLAFNLDFYTDLFDLRNLLPYLENRPADPHAADDDDEHEEEQEDGGIEEEDKNPSSFPAANASSAFTRKYHRLNEALCDLVEDFSLVSFQTLNIQDAQSIARVLAVVDKCNGYLLGAEERRRAASEGGGGEGGEARLIADLEKLAFRAMPDADRIRDVQDRYMGGMEEEEGTGK